MHYGLSNNRSLKLYSQFRDDALDRNIKLRLIFEQLKLDDLQENIVRQDKIRKMK